jgi:hypothetical protein
VPQRIVHGLETVEVHEQHAYLFSGPTGAGKRYANFGPAGPRIFTLTWTPIFPQAWIRLKKLFASLRPAHRW